MAVIVNISKIQLRRGLQTDLQPENLSTGEMGFAVDTGRLFIGSDPDETGLWSSRVLPPYDSIEILTEASVETFARLFDRLHRTLGPIGVVDGAAGFDRRPYLEAELPIASSWSPVLVKIADQGTGLFENAETEDLVLARGDSVGGKIEYFLLDTATVSRTGTLFIIHDGNGDSDEARVVDECIAFPKIAGNGTPIVVDDLFTTGVQFRAVRVGSGLDTVIRLEYKNTEASAYTMQLRAMVTSRLIT
jgi:hypothetical protein